MNRLSAPDAAMLLPASLPRDRVLEAIRWLGISADMAASLSSVTFEPGAVTFTLWDFSDGEPRTVTVEARIR